MPLSLSNFPRVIVLLNFDCVPLGSFGDHTKDTDSVFTNHHKMWWRSVQIGSLKFSTWSTVNETVSLRQVQTIFQTTSPVYLIVIKSLDPLEIVGVIFPKTVECAVASIKDDKTAMQQPVIQVDGLVSTNYKLMPISGGVIGDLEDAFADGSLSVILYRSTHILSKVQSNNNEEIGAVERKHAIAVITRADLKRWIGEVEGHHNMTESE